MQNSNQIFETVNFFNQPVKNPLPNEDSQKKSNQSKERELRELGRWNLQESQRYLQVVKECDEKDVIKALRKAIPNRLQSQIRAHHSKMMKKYGSIQRIIEVSNRKQNKVLIQIGKKLKTCVLDLKQVEKVFYEKHQEISRAATD